MLAILGSLGPFIPIILKVVFAFYSYRYATKEAQKKFIDFVSELDPYISKKHRAKTMSQVDRLKEEFNKKQLEKNNPKA